MQRKSFWVWLGLLLAWLCGIPEPAMHAADAVRSDLSWVQTWGYQLQNADPAELAASPYDLVVIDYSRDGSDETAYTRAEIQQIQKSGKLVLAYLSIGEAEDYRFYWREEWDERPPAFLGPENPDWPGNYEVRYWVSAWWKIAVRPYLDKVLAAGFDGVYLDIIDGYYYWGTHGFSERKSADRMMRLVVKIAAYCRRRAGSTFIVCPQNGLGVLDDASERWKRRYLKAVDAVGVEDVFFNIWSPEDQAYRLSLLQTVAAAGKRIFNVEYIPPDQYDAYEAAVEASGLDIVTYAADPDRELDELLIHGSRPAIREKMDVWRNGALLRGANVYQRRVYPELDGPDFMGPGPLGPPYTQEDFDRLAANGANLVVISHPGPFSENPDYGLDADVENNLDRLIAMAAEADVFVVIALRTGPGRSEFTFLLEGLGDWFDEEYLNDAVWTDPAAQDAWVAMWRHVAQRYRDNPVVIGYDLMVEPNSNEVGGDAVNGRLDVWDPETFYEQYEGATYDWIPFYKRIVAAIREEDPTTPILIEAMGYAAVDWLPWLETLEDPRIVYVVHQYAPYAFTHQARKRCRYPGVCDLEDDGERVDFNKSWLENLLATVRDFQKDHDVPVAVTEFGAFRWARGAPAFLNDEMDLFETQGWNYAIWLWECSWPPYVQEESAFNFRFGTKKSRKRDDPANPLSRVIQQHWRRNWLRPSSVEFR